MPRPSLTLPFREWLSPSLWVGVLTLLLLLAAYLVLQPQPPRHVVLATGVDQGAYAEFGRRYAELMKPHGITVELRPTQGAAENLALLRDPHSGVDLAFVQGGSDERTAAEAAADTEGLVSLGSLFHEPVWLFYREDAALRHLKVPTLGSLSQLAGWQVNVGAPGSGVPPLMARLLEANQISAGALKLSQLPLTPAVVELLEGRMDALVLASAPESPMVQMLLQTPGIRLFDFVQAEAYARRFAFMSAVTLPRGLVNLAADQPPADVHLVAPTATLLAREQLHPALVQLFMQAATQVHGEAGWFQRKGEFPNAANTERPLAPEAQRYFRTGPPWLQRYLPFWLANLVDRMWVMLLSIVVVVIPLMRVLPPLYQMRIRSRVFRWYAQLREVEEARGRRPAEVLQRELDEIDAKVERIKLPLSYADELYALRSHIQLVRKRVST
jgi:TRAP-type uncharacterized transport system substrate-binding protein